MKILGYSERGILNALLYEIYNHKNGDLLNELIGKAKFPFASAHPSSSGATITTYIEHSFSKYFGDPDVMFLIESGEKKCVVFVEAKVKKDRLVSKELDKFIEGPVEGKSGHSSLIFMQLYHKLLVIKNDIKVLTKKHGLCTTEWKKMKTRYLGKNEVVLDTVKKIKEFSDNAFYLMLVPDSENQAANFFTEVLEKRNGEIKSHLCEWDSSHFGYLTWKQVEDFCEEKNLANTLAVFKHNGAQIYKKDS